MNLICINLVKMEDRGKRKHESTEQETAAIHKKFKVKDSDEESEEVFEIVDDDANEEASTTPLKAPSIIDSEIILEQCESLRPPYMIIMEKYGRVPKSPESIKRIISRLSKVYRAQRVMREFIKPNCEVQRIYIRTIDAITLYEELKQFCEQSAEVSDNVYKYIKAHDDGLASHDLYKIVRDCNLEFNATLNGDKLVPLPIGMPPLPPLVPCSAVVRLQNNMETIDKDKLYNEIFKILENELLYNVMHSNIEYPSYIQNRNMELVNLNLRSKISAVYNTCFDMNIGNTIEIINPYCAEIFARIESTMNNLQRNIANMSSYSTSAKYISELYVLLMLVMKKSITFEYTRVGWIIKGIIPHDDEILSGTFRYSCLDIIISTPTQKNVKIGINENIYNGIKALMPSLAIAYNLIDESKFREDCRNVITPRDRIISQFEKISSNKLAESCMLNRADSVDERTYNHNVEYVRKQLVDGMRRRVFHSKIVTPYCGTILLYIKDTIQLVKTLVSSLVDASKTRHYILTIHKRIIYLLSTSIEFTIDTNCNIQVTTDLQKILAKDGHPHDRLITY
jgi:hypothetical protein